MNMLAQYDLVVSAAYTPVSLSTKLRLFYRVPVNVTFHVPFLGCGNLTFSSLHFYESSPDSFEVHSVLFRWQMAVEPWQTSGSLTQGPLIDG